MIVSILILLTTLFWMPGFIDAYDLPKSAYLNLLSLVVLTLLLFKNKTSLPLLKPILLFIVCLFLSYFTTINNQQFINQVSLDISGICIFWYIVNYVKTYQIKLLFNILLFISILIIINGYAIHYLYGLAPKEVAPPIGSRTFASFLVMVSIPAIIYLLSSEFVQHKFRALKTIGGFLYIAIAFHFMYYNISTSAIMSSFAALFLIAIYLSKDLYLRRATINPITGFIVVVCIALVFSFSSIAKIINYKLPSLFSISYNSLHISTSSIQNLILGVGRGNFDIVYPKYISYSDYPSRHDLRVNHVHNDYIEIMNETGIIGLAAFLYLIYNIFRPLKKIKEADYLTVTLSSILVSILIWAVFQFPFEQPVPVMLFWFITGLLFVKYKEQIPPRWSTYVDTYQG